MTRTKIVDGRAPHARDHDVIRALLSVAIPGGTGTEFLVGIRNEAGDVYRLVRLYGLAEKVNFARKLAELGFIDELDVLKHSPEGYDGVYGESCV